MHTTLVIKGLERSISARAKIIIIKPRDWVSLVTDQCQGSYNIHEVVNITF